MSRAKTRPFRAPDGVTWTVIARAPGASNLMIVFLHPDRSTTERDRYAWWINAGPESRDVTARLDGPKVLSALSDDELAALFRRSMLIDTGRPGFEAA